jgi:hypothetical protein
VWRGRYSLGRVILLAPIALTVHCAATRADPQSDPGPSFLTQVRAEFAKRNPRVTQVTLLDLVPRAQFRPNSGYIVLAHGIREDHLFEGSFEDELFAVFLVDDVFSKVTRVLKWIPSRRWYDYTFAIEHLDPLYKEPRKMTLVGAGATYNDSPMRIEIIVPPLE